MLSTYWRNKVLDAMYVSSTERQFYVGLSSTKPNLNGTGVGEPSGGNYSRVRVTRFSEPENGVITNAESLQFPTSTAEWFSDANKAAYYVIFDGPTTAAHVIGAGALYAAMPVDENVELTIPPGMLSITLTDEPE